MRCGYRRFVEFVSFFFFSFFWICGNLRSSAGRASVIFVSENIQLSGARKRQQLSLQPRGTAGASVRYFKEIQFLTAASHRRPVFRETKASRKKEVDGSKQRNRGGQNCATAWKRAERKKSRTEIDVSRTRRWRKQWRPERTGVRLSSHRMQKKTEPGCTGFSCTIWRQWGGSRSFGPLFPRVVETRSVGSLSDKTACDKLRPGTAAKMTRHKGRSFVKHGRRTPDGGRETTDTKPHSFTLVITACSQISTLQSRATSF